MPLSQQVKDALDGMNNVDKALVVLYVFGVDDNALAASIGEEFLRYQWPNVDPETATNNQKAKAFLQALRNHGKHIYIYQKSDTAGRLARESAHVDAQDDFVFTEDDPQTDD